LTTKINNTKEPTNKLFRYQPETISSLTLNFTLAMFANTAVAAAVALLALPASVAAAPQHRSAPEPSLTTQLRLADTYVEPKLYRAKDSQKS
jgi:hypothetical protein